MGNKMIKVTRNRRAGKITLSRPCDIRPADLTNHQLNRLVSQLLRKLATVIAAEELFEFDGVDEPRFVRGRVSITAHVFIP